MAGIRLYDYQEKAVHNMSNGCILCGGVGSGKSRTALAYFYVLNGGLVNTEEYSPMDDLEPMPDLYIITTARKRDTLEWEKELIPFLISTDPKSNMYNNKVVVDSWNNIKKYVDVKNAFFIFDEQRVVGKGQWVRSFLKITKSNQWILLSATPGDTWTDYIPVFIANGFYKNRTAFLDEHVIFKHTHANFPQIDRYVGVKKLERFRDKILVNMDFERKTLAHDLNMFVEYDKELYKTISRNRWDPWNNCPIENASDFCYLLRKAVNSTPERFETVRRIVKEHPRVIVFYNFDYELDGLKAANYGEGVKIAEWNGHKHEDVPESESWVYLVQYTAGAEGWNCITTDTIIFFSQNYSYKTMVQAAGRIDRLNTPYHNLYYYHLKSRSGIDLAIAKALEQKRNFNEGRFYKNE